MVYGRSAVVRAAPITPRRMQPAIHVTGTIIPAWVPMVLPVAVAAQSTMGLVQIVARHLATALKDRDMTVDGVSTGALPVAANT